MRHILSAAVVLGVLWAAWSTYGPRAGESCAAAAPEKGAAAATPPAKPDAPAPELDPMSANGACYVCHMTFVKEEISKVHLAAKVPCSKCHGTSAKHANDEDIGASKPDIIYKHDQVDAMCQKCHEQHDAPARAVIARFVERKLDAKTTACTGCHGEHKIEAPAEAAAAATATGG